MDVYNSERNEEMAEKMIHQARGNEADVLDRLSPRAMFNDIEIVVVVVLYNTLLHVFHFLSFLLFFSLIIF